MTPLPGLRSCEVQLGPCNLVEPFGDVVHKWIGKAVALGSIKHCGVTQGYNIVLLSLKGNVIVPVQRIRLYKKVIHFEPRLFRCSALTPSGPGADEELGQFLSI